MAQTACRSNNCTPGIVPLGIQPLSGHVSRSENRFGKRHHRIQLLRQQGKPRSQAELQARKQLELCHSQVMQQLQTKSESLQRQMQQLLAQQEGMSAYQLTQLSQPEFQEGNMSKGDLY